MGNQASSKKGRDRETRDFLPFGWSFYVPQYSFLITILLKELGQLIRFEILALVSNEIYFILLSLFTVPVRPGGS